MKQKKWNKKDSIGDSETSLYHSRNVDATMPRLNAVWLVSTQIRDIQ